MKVKDVIAFLKTVDPELECYARWDTEDDNGYDPANPMLVKVTERYDNTHVFDAWEARVWPVEQAVKQCGEKWQEAWERAEIRRREYCALPWRDAVVFETEHARS